MRVIISVFVSLLLVQFLTCSAFAVGSTNSAPKLQPLSGKSDIVPRDESDDQAGGRLDMGPPGRDTSVKPKTLFPLSVQRSHLRGDAENAQLQSGTMDHQLHGGAMDQQLQALHGNTDDSTLHGGTNDRGPLAGQAAQEPNNMGRDTFKMNLTPREVAMLGMHDIVVIVDKSYSMGTHDCPSGGFGGGGLGGGGFSGGGFSGGGFSGGGGGESGFSNLSKDKKDWTGKDWSKGSGSSGLGGLADLAAGLAGLGGGSSLNALGGSFFGSDESRWEWCSHQLQDLTRQVSRVPNRGITVVVFDSKYRAFDNVSPMQIPEIFANFHPWNGTKLFPPLADELNQYFRRRAQGRAKPLLIAIITDGHPHDAKMLGPLLVQATQQMRNPSEIAITLLQVGNDPEGEHFVDSLDSSLMMHGARYDIVRGKTFRELMQTGLTRALLDAMTPPRTSSR